MSKIAADKLANKQTDGQTGRQRERRSDGQTSKLINWPTVELASWASQRFCASCIVARGVCAIFVDVRPGQWPRCRRRCRRHCQLPYANHTQKNVAPCPQSFVRRDSNWLFAVFQFSVFGYGVSVLFFIFVVHFFFISLRANNQFFSLFAAVVVAFAQGRRWLVLCLIIKKNRNDDVIVIIVVAAVEVVVSICIALRAFSHLAQLIAFYDHSFSMQSRPISRRIRAQFRLRIRFRIWNRIPSHNQVPKPGPDPTEKPLGLSPIKVSQSHSHSHSIVFAISLRILLLLLLL